MADLKGSGAPEIGDGSNGDYYLDVADISQARVARYGPKADSGGTAQVETATVVGAIEAAGAGNATVIITAAGMTGSPKTKSVAVANNDTAAQVAAKIRADLEADEDVAELFAVSGEGAAVVLTKLAAAANDATLNIDINNGTCAGLTDAPTSANTTAGVAHTSQWPAAPADILRDAQIIVATVPPAAKNCQPGTLHYNPASGALSGPHNGSAWPTAASAV